MVWKKAIALLFGLMMVATTASFGHVSAADTSVTVILVSDNEADCTLAQYLANMTGAVVVTTPWGVYDPNVTAGVMSYGPDNVIIIGGPDAVVDRYLDDLKELNITVERWWGRNRYETNLAVIGNATAKLRIKFENHVIVVPGNDTAAIRVALRKAVKVHGVIIFANDTTNITRVMMKIEAHPKNMTLIRSHVMVRMTERLRERFENRVGANVTEVDVNITPEMAMEAINTSEERIASAEELLANVTLPPQRDRVAEKMLNLAKKELERARNAYDDGEYGRAYGQAIAAKAHAEFVIRMASNRWETEIEKNNSMRFQVYLWRIEVQISALERAGINTTELKGLVEELKTAVKNGDYDVADTLMWKIRYKLLELYTQGRWKFKGIERLPVGRGHEHP
ncbi:cell wall-binding repeat-containing protein [Thermococcus camini]|uniref:Cell wall-binding repeat 2 family protein n=1 Tax=Thermococcus camini TaxID=2016373 RepID=A0A7G2D7H3_9EURY|nr:hypothetical protein [Thermococcus camini]CAD5244300.1 conserved exported protein of unknown function [Thermococcus camini]